MAIQPSVLPAARLSAALPLETGGGESRSAALSLDDTPVRLKSRGCATPGRFRWMGGSVLTAGWPSRAHSPTHPRCDTGGGPLPPWSAALHSSTVSGCPLWFHVESSFRTIDWWNKYFLNLSVRRASWSQLKRRDDVFAPKLVMDRICKELLTDRRFCPPVLVGMFCFPSRSRLSDFSTSWF